MSLRPNHLGTLLPLDTKCERCNCNCHTVSTELRKLKYIGSAALLVTILGSIIGAANLALMLNS